VDLDVGSVVNAELDINWHPAIVLSSKKEIEENERVFVVAISNNENISPDEDRIKVPRGLDVTGHVQCDVTQSLPLRKIRPRKTQRRARGPFLAQVQKQVRAADDRKKSTR
jgi:mRNA-degrading endonuclease toxin of MazEF toxin-antitoxin module